jgi:CrcB protein
MDPRRAVAVAIGAMVGAGIRWAALRVFGAGAVDAVLLSVNVAGCLLLGVLSQLPPPAVDSRTMAFLGAGLCGGLTTWSSLAVETAADLRVGDWMPAAPWLAVNLVAGTAAAVAGRRLGRR